MHQGSNPAAYDADQRAATERSRGVGLYGYLDGEIESTTESLPNKLKYRVI